MKNTAVTRRRFLEGAWGLTAFAFADRINPFSFQRADGGQSARQGDWLRTGFDIHNTRFNPNENTIGAGNVGRLKLKWRFDTLDNWVIQQTPAVVGDSLFFGSGRYHYAIDSATGKLKWKWDWGTDGEWERSAYQPTLKNRGTRSSPQYVNGKLYFGTASCAVYCLDAASGNKIWKTRLLDDERLEKMEANIFYSPVVHAGKLFIGYSGSDATLYCLDADTGAIRWQFRVAQDVPVEYGIGGGSLWTSGAIDEKTNVVYNVTGSNKAFMPNLNLYTESVVAHDMDTGELLWYHQPYAQDAFDLDFNCHPIIVDAAAPARIRGSVRPSVVAGGKAGIYCLDRHTGERYWKVMLGQACGGCGPAINAMASAYNRVYVQWASPASNTPMAVTAGLNAYTGDIEWIVPNSGINASPIAVANGVLYQGTMKGQFEALDANNGRRLWEFQMPSPFRGGAAIANGAVYASNGEATSWTGEDLPYAHSMCCFTVDGT